jgi:hypothetical protein
MSGTIWLITEDESDADAVRVLLAAHGFPVRVEHRKLTGGSGGISRIVDQLERLIKTAQTQKGKDDCIAVLHDADEYQQPDRRQYDAIEQLCRQYGVKHVIAHDELESWLLADEGVSQWLGIRHENWDNRQKPSHQLNHLMKQKIGHKYQGVYKGRVLEKLNAHSKSPSLKKALQYLDNAACVR